MSCVSGQSSVVGHWRFEQGSLLSDSSGNGLSLTNVGSMAQDPLPGSGNGSDFPDPVRQAGDVNSGVARFTATSGLSGFSSADQAVLDTVQANGTFTIEAFINSGTGPAQSGAEDARYILAQFDSATTQRSFAWQVNSQDGFTLFLANAPGSDFGSLKTGGGLIASNTDYFVAVTYSVADNLATFYWQDLTNGGVLRSTSASFASPMPQLADSAAAMTIGYRADSQKRWRAAGVIDEVRLSNTVLSPEDFLVPSGPVGNVSGSITISTDFDAGSMASATVSGDVVTLRPRTYPFNNNTTSWWNYFRINGVAGRTLTFVYDTAGLQMHGHRTATRYVISYDQEDWVFPDSTSGSGNSYSFTHTFTQDTAWVAYGIPYPVSRVDAKMAEWSSSPWVGPAPSSDADLKIVDTATGAPWLTPGGANEVGFAIPRHPLYAFSITDPRVTGPKPSVVIMAGNHSGEPTGNHTLDGLVDWLLGDAPRAVALRRAAKVFVYPMCDPDGRYGGYSRCNQTLPDGDHNREWDTGSDGTLPEVDQVQAAMRLDCGSNATFFLDIHNQAEPDDSYMYVNNGWQNTPFVQGMLTYLSPFRLNMTTNLDTRIARPWALVSSDGLNAANSFTMEPGSWPVTTPAMYHQYGQAMGWSLFDALVDEADYYLWAGAASLSGDDALPGADPDGDGLINRWEQGIGSDPAVREPAYVPTHELAGNVFRMSYVQPAGGTGTPGQDYVANGIQIVLQKKTVLTGGTWETVADPVQVWTSPIDAQKERVEIDCPMAGPSAFYRLLVLPADP